MSSEKGDDVEDEDLIRVGCVDGWMRPQKRLPANKSQRGDGGGGRRGGEQGVEDGWM